MLYDYNLIASRANLGTARQHLQRNDPRLQPIIEQHGLPDFVPHTDYYQALVSEIIGQQLSVKAAAAIRKKFVDLFGGTFPLPDAILAISPDELRSAGLSWAKVTYVQDLARHILGSKIQFDRFDTLSNEEITKELIDVKGIGEWTSHMFLMFCIGRLDVLPTGDLGIKNGIRALYGLKDIPTPEQITQLAKKYNWHPYESVASWYIWASLDNKPDS